jgi:NADH-quinone oxidoreductase subunit G
VLGEGGNTVGAQLVGAQPANGGLNAAEMLAKPLKAYVLLHTEPVLEAADGARAAAALAGAEMVVALTPFRDANVEHADVLLPVSPFTETAGSFVNAEGRLQSFHGVVRPLAETRPAWKVLRVLGNLLGLAGFEQDSVEEVRAEALGDGSAIAARLSNASQVAPQAAAAGTGLERIADVPLYATDALVRRAPALQATADAAAPRAALNAALWSQLGLATGDAVTVRSPSGAVTLPAVLDATLAPRAVRVSAGHAATVALGAPFTTLEVTRA